MSSASQTLVHSLEQSTKEEARRLGFFLAGVATPDRPEHVSTFEAWLAQGRHGTMAYLATERSCFCRADPRQLLPDCESIIVLAAPYSKPEAAPGRSESPPPRGRVAAYAWGQDYHDVLPARMRALVKFIEAQLGRSIPHRCLTDSAPVLERDLAQRAGLGWIGKNTCLINPKMGSYFLLAEILLSLPLHQDHPVLTDHCGTCTRCIEACPTHCILPDRTLDARKCISYLTIELKGSVAESLRAAVGSWVFGCDICQTVCPWNRFAPAKGDEAFDPSNGRRFEVSLSELDMPADEFKAKYKRSPIMRAKHAGFERNLAIVAGNSAGAETMPVLRAAAERGDAEVKEHCDWAIKQITRRTYGNSETAGRHQ